MLDFPSAPSVGQKYPAAPIGGVPTYVWDGEKWTSVALTDGTGYLPLLGGTLAGPLSLAADPTVPWGAATKQYANLGVTDGGDAAAGQIGEVLSIVRTSSLGLTNSTMVRLMMLTLTPGDWDVFGEVWTNASAGGLVTSYNISLGKTDAAGPSVPDMTNSRAQLGAASSTIQVVSVGPARASVSVATPYYVNVLFNFSSGSVTAVGKLWARRAR